MYDSDVAEMKAAVEAVEVGPVLRAVRDTDKALEHLGEVVRVLSRRLEPVLRPDEPRPDNRSDSPIETNSQLTASIRMHGMELAALRIRVERLLERLDV